MTDDPGTAVSELGYTEASQELDRIVAFFEQREVDVDQLVARLERATAIVDELDRRLRKTRAQVDELVPRLEAAAGLATPVAGDGDEDDEALADEWGEIVDPDDDLIDIGDDLADTDPTGAELVDRDIDGDAEPAVSTDEPEGLF